MRSRSIIKFPLLSVILPATHPEYLAIDYIMWDIDLHDKEDVILNENVKRGSGGMFKV